MKADLGTGIPDERYKADLELLDRYQGYSAELVRLSILGIGAMAYFFTDIALGKDSPPYTHDMIVLWAFGIASLLFTVATACALSHRYHSSSGFASHLKAVRLTLLETPLNQPAVVEAERRNQTYAVAGRWLAGAVCSFGAGGFLFFVAVARLIVLLQGAS